MLILAIDTCDARGSVCLLDELGTAHTVVHDSAEDYSTWLLPAVDRALALAGRQFSDVTLYGTTAGPGSFTGIRIALTTVKAWNEVFRVSVASVSRLEVLAGQAKSVSSRADYVVACLDAGRQQLFGGVFRREGQALRRLGDEAVFTPEELIQRAGAQAGGSSVAWVALDPAGLTGNPAWQLRAEKGEGVEQLSGIVAPAVAVLARRMAAENRLTGALTLDANYIRRPDAEVKWKGYAKPVV